MAGANPSDDIELKVLKVEDQSEIDGNIISRELEDDEQQILVKTNGATQQSNGQEEESSFTKVSLKQMDILIVLPYNVRDII